MVICVARRCCVEGGREERGMWLHKLRVSRWGFFFLFREREISFGSCRGFVVVCSWLEFLEEVETHIERKVCKY